MTTSETPPVTVPAEPQTTARKMQQILEGSAVMEFPVQQEQVTNQKKTNGKTEEATTVFYNPVQVQNRDLSVLMIALHAERIGRPLQVLDALAASGLRSIRYWKELTTVIDATSDTKNSGSSSDGPNHGTRSSCIAHITVNDLDPAATELAAQNIVLNHVPAAADRTEAGIRVVTGDATSLMYASRTSYGTRNKTMAFTNVPATAPRGLEEMQWDVIDLDPYGSAAPFLDAAIQAVRHGGLLNITCTDMVALGGAHPETCFGRYHAMPIQRGMHLHEMAVRILLYTIATTAGRYGRSIEPVLSVGMDFYVRVFCRVLDSKAPVNDLSLQCGLVYQSMLCQSFHIVPHGQKGGKKGNVYQAARLKHGTCTETGGTFKIGGPIWLGPMHDREILAKALERLGQDGGGCGEKKLFPDTKYLKTKERLQGLLTACLEELPNAPLYYKVSDLAKTLHVSAPPALQFKSALVNAGYEVSGYHKEPDAIKTTAPPDVVWDVLRAWAKLHPPKPPKEDTAAAKILAVEPTTTIDFTLAPSVVQQSKVTSNVKRFPMNPEANWGPKPRATGKRKADAQDVVEPPTAS